ncbi:uncharacterized protein [Gossypium hirsutum]|uniref:Uncharacterized protein n=1 Tax=Gossypium hirsutum TaxID=3635 RepID=A0ABM3BWD1_GOSHI|nr:uncharacterized protein LOC107895631 [Gossypium hirsutum]
MQAIGRGTVHLQRGFQQPPRGRGQARGCNGTGRGRGALGKACTVFETLGIMVENTMSDVIVLGPLGQSVRVNKLFKDVPLEVQGMVFLADLMELPFEEFDIILGMDWLVKHQANLDCDAKRMLLRTKKREEVIVIGERRNCLPNVISTLKAKKLVHKGCKAYLAYVNASGSEVSSLKDIRTVKDFSDFFPNELPGLPPNCYWNSVVCSLLKEFLSSLRQRFIQGYLTLAIKVWGALGLDARFATGNP